MSWSDDNYPPDAAPLHSLALMRDSSKRKQPRTRQVSQREIGLLAGVSQATVSLVLAGQKVNSEETRQRVLDAARRLKYRPNLLVHGMQTGKSKTIGVMAPPYDYYWSRILYGIHDTLAQNDYVPITVWPIAGEQRSGYETDELAQIHRLLDRRVDGVILWPPFASLFSEHVQEFSSRDMPIVTIDHELPDSFRADSVGNDESNGGRMVAEHLLALGHRRLGQVAGPSFTTWGRARRKSFDDAVAQVQSATCITVEAPPGSAKGATELVRQLLQADPRPTAIFAGTDPIAKLIYRVATELKLRIPEDVSVVGYADHDFAVEMVPPMTTVRQPAYEIGREAAQLVIERSLGVSRRPVPTHIKLPVQLVVRESTSPPAGGRES